MAKWEITIPLFVAVIGVIGTLIPIFLNSSNIREKPDIYASISPDTTQSIQFSTLTIGNRGSAPATNLSGVFMSPVKISWVTNEFSGTEIFTEKNGNPIKIDQPIRLNDSVFQFYIPKLVQGTGTVVELKLLFENVTLPSFRVSLVYDQGSVGFTKATDIIDLLSEFWSIYSDYYTALYIAILLASFVLIGLHLRKSGKKKFVSDIIHNLIDIREKIMKNNGTTESFRFDWYSRELRLFNMITLICNKYQVITDVKDYVLLNDLNTKIEERERIVGPELAETHPDEVFELNMQCLRLVNKSLQIEWEKYR